jgi:hypothetical protein
VSTTCQEEEGWLRIDRGLSSILCNFALEPRRIPFFGRTNSELLLASKLPLIPNADEVEMPAESVAVWSLAPEAADAGKAWQVSASNLQRTHSIWDSRPDGEMEAMPASPASG